MRYVSPFLAAVWMLTPFLLWAGRAVYIDPVGANAPAGWNNVSFVTSNATALLNDSLTNATGIRLTVVTPLQGPNTAASASPAGAAAEFKPASTNSAYGNTTVWGGKVIPFGLAIFSNLVADTAYHFTFYASRTGASDNREALYTVTGANSGSNTLNASGNSSHVAAVSNIFPRADGTLTLRIERGPNNNEANGFFYLTAMKVAYEPPPAVDEEAPKRLLFFGNSFSLVGDVPGHVASLAAIAGHTRPLVVADLLGGQDLAYHITQVDGYPENNVANAALAGTNTWDHVVIQGYSTEATHLRDPMVFKTNAAALFQRVRNHASGKGAGAGAVLYQTWARAPGHSFYPASFATPAAMQLEIRTNYQAAAELIAADEPAADLRLAPVGDAFERGGFPLDFYGADLYHADNLGPLLAALVLYKTIYGATVTNIPYADAVAAGWTTMSSNDWTRVTSLAEGLAPPEEPPAKPPAPLPPGAREVFLIAAANSGAAAVPGWNAILFTGLNTGTLVLTNGYQTDVACTVLARLNAANTYGAPSPTGAAALFAPAGVNSAYGNVNPFNGSYSNDYAVARFSGLSPRRRYTFTLYASRVGVSDSRETLYTLTGANSGSAALEARNNSSEVAVVADILPRPDGTVDLRLEPGPNNTSASQFYHLTALKIESVRSGALLLIGP